SIVVDPRQRLSRLEMLDEEEREKLIGESGFHAKAQSRTQRREESLGRLFEIQVEKNRDAVAVTFANEALTYGELNRKASQLAHYLRKLGVGPESKVGLCMERSPEMLIGLLGILKAGGSYVPLDPAYPSQRLSFMVADTQMPLLLSQRSQRNV